MGLRTCRACRHHENVTLRELARRLAALKGYGFGEEFEAGRPYRGRLYYVPNDTLVGLDAPSGDSNDELDAIACPSATRCTAVDTLGNVVTFNPRSSHDAASGPTDARGVRSQRRIRPAGPRATTRTA